MLSKPSIKKKGVQSYVAIRKTVPMKEIPALLPPLIPQIAKWMADHDIKPTGPEFFNYLSMDKDNNIVSEVGYPVESKVQAEGDVVSDDFPAGHYAHLTYTGDYKFMMDAHKGLDKFIAENGFKEERSLGAPDFPHGVRTEVYLTDPDVEPDPAKWITEIYVLLEPSK